MEQARIEQSTVLPLSRSDAWSRVVDEFSRWFGDDASLEPRPGGRVTSGDRTGHLTSYLDRSELRWEWSLDGDPGWTEVEISLHEVGDGTEIRIVEVLHEWEQVTYESLGVSRGGGSMDELMTR